MVAFDQESGPTWPAEAQRPHKLQLGLPDSEWTPGCWCRTGWSPCPLWSSVLLEGEPGLHRQLQVPFRHCPCTCSPHPLVRAEGPLNPARLLPALWGSGESVSVGGLGIHEPCEPLGAPGPGSSCARHLAEPNPEAAVAAPCKVLPLPTTQISPLAEEREQHPSLEQTLSRPPLPFRAACVGLVSGPHCPGLETMPKGHLVFWAALVALSLERPASTHRGPVATSQ